MTLIAIFASAFLAAMEAIGPAVPAAGAQDRRVKGWVLVSPPSTA
jgi:hypothetical protein